MTCLPQVCDAICECVCVCVRNRPNKKHPGMLRRLGLRIAEGARAVVAQPPSGAQTPDRDDQLAQPLLQEDEEQGAGQLDDIREVDLEAGEGSSIARAETE